jgi:glutathione-specific gamma-glutamylcyclotransferase
VANSPRQMALTTELVALTRREVADPGPVPGLIYHSEADYDAWVDAMLASHPVGEDLWLFAYGSLIWKPDFEHVEARTATARGWHRSFCFSIKRFRATPECPGLMMALDRGGQAQGIIYRLSAAGLREQLGRLFRREFTVKPPNSMPRWITVDAGGEKIRAITFVMNRLSPFYVGRLPLADVADILSKACGHWGSGAEYLHNTVAHLEASGIHDRNLWKLQELVADRLVTSRLKR